MPTTDFTSGTVITSTWLNEVDSHIFEGKDFTGRVIDVTDPTFGAVGDGIANDGPSIQAALNYAESLPGASVYIPSGTYKITTALTVPGTVSIFGCGQGSVIRAYSCHALDFQRSDVVGARRVSNLWLYADTGSSYNGIRINLNTPGGDKITGIVFDNIYISWFGTAVYARGLWHSTFRDCYLLNCYRGIHFDGQSVKNTVTDCTIIRGNASVTGTGDSRGVYSTENTAVRPEDVSVRSCLVYGFDVAIDFESVLFSNVTACDLDYCQKVGVRATQVDGGFAVRDSWIAMDTASATAAQRGIDFVNLGAARRSNASISNNRVNRGNTTGGDIGIRIGASHECVVVDGNEVDSFDNGIYVDGGQRTVIANNIVYATQSIFLFACDGVSIRDNYLSNAIYTHPTGVTNTRYGPNTGNQTTYAVGQVTVPSGATTVTVTLASLGIAPIVVGAPSRHRIMISWNNDSATTRGEVWGSCDGTNLTCNVTSSFGVNYDQQFVIQVF